ncbi:hypothetical protein [Galbibacter sp.]|uniref:hypothetical protein n=1 Tax=Galbibacter sp. TaxID=2918471 RepID=UPI003A95B5AE
MHINYKIALGLLGELIIPLSRIACLKYPSFLFSNHFKIDDVSYIKYKVAPAYLLHEKKMSLDEIVDYNKNLDLEQVLKQPNKG